MAAAMTGLAVLIISNAAAAGLVFMTGHRRGRRSCRNEYPDGWDGGVAAERERGEQVTGATYERLLAGVASDPPDVPGNDGWPYLFTNLQAAGERRKPPTKAELFAAADTMLGLPPRVPVELEDRPPVFFDDHDLAVIGMYEDEPPVVAEITDARPSGFVKYEGDVPPQLLYPSPPPLAPDPPPLPRLLFSP